MGSTESRKRQATFDSNQTCCRSCESAETYSVRAAKFQKKKKTTKIAGGVASAAALGTGALAGGTAGTIAVAGTIASIAVGIPTLGVGLLVGLAATAGTAGAAAGIAGIGGAVATHFIAKHYEEDEANFREVQGDFQRNCANMTHEDVGYIVEAPIFLGTEWSDTTSVTTDQSETTSVTTDEPPQPRQQPMHTFLDVSSAPTLKDILQLVVSPVAAKWNHVAIHLDVETFIIDNISKNFPDNCEGACLDMLKRWLSREHHTGYQERTWSTLLSALNAAGCVEFEQRLRREHFISQGT